MTRKPKRNGLDGVFRTSSKAQPWMVFLLMMPVVWSAPGCPYDKLPALADADRSHCESDDQCTPLVCDVSGAMTCVQCTANEASVCAATTPVCVNNQCQKCTAHAQCAASNVCLPDGSCADTTQVAYVDPGGSDNMECSQMSPCTKVMKALMTNRPYVKFHGTTDEAVSINDQNVMLLADPGAKLTRTSNGLLLEVKGTSRVAIYDLEVTGASGGVAGAGISLPSGNTVTLELQRVKVTNNAGDGISVTDGTLTVSQSILSGNFGSGISAIGGTLTVSQSTVSENVNGGILVGGLGKFVIIGNVFFANGTETSAAGALNISTSQSATNRLEFNNFSHNVAPDSIGSAISCSAGAFTARNNIMSGNGTLTNQEQVGGPCAHTYSIARPGVLPVGTGNKPTIRCSRTPRRATFTFYRAARPRVPQILVRT